MIGTDRYFQVYYLLRYQNRNTKIKSLITNEITEADWVLIRKDDSNVIAMKLSMESVIIESLIKKIEKGGFVFNFKVFSDFWFLSKYPIISKFQDFISWSYEYRFNKDLDLYQTANFETYQEILIKLKEFIIDNPSCFSDEIYLIQLFDQKFIKILESSLHENSRINIWEVKEKEKNEITPNNVVLIEYSLKGYNTIDFLVENLIKQRPFHLDIRKCIAGCTIDEMAYFKNVITCICSK